MKKYRITDVDTTESFDIEQIEDETVEPAETATETEEVSVNDEDALTAEEIAALKRLAGCADALIAMCSAGSDETVTDEEEVEETVEEEPVEETVVETEDCDTKDSKKSFGSIEKRKQSTSDSATVDEISIAWAKRYGGNK